MTARCSDCSQHIDSYDPLLSAVEEVGRPVTEKKAMRTKERLSLMALSFLVKWK